MPKRRKRGRPATGHDPILGVRVPAKVIRKIDLLGEALSMDRSATVRRLLERGLDYDSYLMRTTKGKGVTGEVVSIWAELEKARAAEVAAKCAKRRKDKVAAEINAHRATAKADEKSSALADRIALQNANKTPAPSRPGGPPAAVHKQPPRGARRLSEAEIKAAADRAEARSRLLHSAVIVEDESEPAAPIADRRHA
jgi:nicotinamidase-related amidase